MKKTIISLCLTSILALSGCSLLSPYTPPVEQGKVISKDIMHKIKPGMTKQQVLYLLGTPDIVDPFSPGRWNYVYSYQKTHYTLRKDKQLILTFKGNKVVQVNGDYPPPFAIYESK